MPLPTAPAGRALREHRGWHLNSGGSLLGFLFCLTLSLLLVSVCLSAQPVQMDRAETMRRARELVEAQHYDAALEIFGRLAAQNPGDIEARNWMARLESWKGNHAQAEELYRSVLADAPGDLEAELGLADVLGWQGRYSEALERLLDLRTRQPANAEVLVRLGRISRWQRKRRRALRYYREVLALDPGNTEAREGVDILAAQKSFRLETGYFTEEFDFIGNTHGQRISLLYQDHHRLTLLTAFQYQNKFDQNNTRATLGVTYRFWRRTWVRSEFSWAPAGDTVIANQDYILEVTQGVHPRVAVGGGYRFLNFRDAEVQVLTAQLNLDLRADLHLNLRYTPARTRFQLPARSVWNHGGGTRLVWDVNRTFSPYVSFGVGTENFAGVSADQLGRFAAQTYAGGAVIHLTPAQGLRLGYYFQNRTQDRREQGFGISYFFSF